MKSLKQFAKKKTIMNTQAILNTQNSSSKAHAWLLAIRPKTLFASIGPVILGTSLAYKTYEIFDLTIFIVTLLCALLLQISTNLANDYLDAKKGIDNHDRLGPVRVTHTGLLSTQEVKFGFLLVLFFALLLGLYLMILGGWPIIMIGLLSMWFSYAYSGGPYPLSHHGLGEVAAYIFFGPIATMGTHYLQSHIFDLPTFFIGSGVGMISFSILAINNLRDIQSDSKTKKRTLAVRFGEKFQRALSLSGYLGSTLFLIVFALYTKYYYSLLALLTILPFLSTLHYLKNGEINASLNDRLAMTGKYLFVYSLANSILIHAPWNL